MLQKLFFSQKVSLFNEMKDLEKYIFTTLGSLRTVITIQFSSYYITMKMRANLCCRNTPVITHPIIKYYIIKCGFNPDYYYYKLIRPNDDYLYRINKYKVVKRTLQF